MSYFSELGLAEPILRALAAKGYTDPSPIQRQAIPALLEGRVEGLKKTHGEWLAELFAGNYGDEYFQRRWAIGLTHVRVNVPPHYVEAVVSFLRVESERLLARELVDVELVAKRHASVIKILDLDLMIINHAYGVERIDRLCNFTGMSKVLLQRCIDRS